MAERLATDDEKRFWRNVAMTGAFFTGEAPVFPALRKLAAALDELSIPYALIGGMALNKYGYQRVTIDIDVLMTRDGLTRFKEARLGRGYVEKSPGSRGVRDIELDVGIDVFLTGMYPGDNQPKPVRFPDPAQVAIRKDWLSLIPLTTLLELKLASGMCTIHRMKDLADVIELINTRRHRASSAINSMRRSETSTSSYGTRPRSPIRSGSATSVDVIVDVDVDSQL